MSRHPATSRPGIRDRLGHHHVLLVLALLILLSLICANPSAATPDSAYAGHDEGVPALQVHR